MTETKNATKDLDLVYFCRNGDNEELRYSLRSVAKNMECRQVIIVGGKPDGIEPDIFIQVPQDTPNTTKWDRVRANFRKIALDKRITDDFILMNDDFYINKPTKTLPPSYRFSLHEHIVKIEMRYGDRPTQYTMLLRQTLRELEENGCPAYSYELHIPAIFNKHKLLEILGAFPNAHCTRTLYGNYFEIGGEKTEDVKICTPDQPFDKESQFLSSDDTTWGDTEITKYIKEKFSHPCKFELDNGTQTD